MIGWVVALAAAAPCGGCHAEVEAQWAQSRHATAFTNATFQAAWSRHPDPWCVTCHLPAGVGCPQCHGDDPVAAAPDHDGGAPHRLASVGDFGTRSCAPCHGFTPPDSDVPLQDTVAEHAGQPEGCSDCHMPAGSHLVSGARDRTWVRRVLEVSWTSGAEGWTATLEARGAGHAVPTGDPFRQLLLEVGVGDQVTARHRMGRSVQGVGPTFREVSDTRLPPPGPDGVARQVVALGAPDAAWWRLVFHLTDPSHDELSPTERSWVVHDGPLPPPP